MGWYRSSLISNTGNVFFAPATLGDVPFTQKASAAGFANYSTIGYIRNNAPLIVTNTVNNIYSILSSQSYYNGQVVFLGNNYSIENATYAFGSCINFNQPINIDGDIDNASRMFQTCHNFNQPIIINGNVNDANYMFNYSNNFNSSIYINGSLNIATNMFLNCRNFNAPVHIDYGVVNGNNMFCNCINFNQSVSYVSENGNYPIVFANNCRNMLYNCNSFNSSITIYKNITTYAGSLFKTNHYDLNFVTRGDLNPYNDLRLANSFFDILFGNNNNQNVIVNRIMNVSLYSSAPSNRNQELTIVLDGSLYSNANNNYDRSIVIERLSCVPPMFRGINIVCSENIKSYYSNYNNKNDIANYKYIGPISFPCIRNWGTKFSQYVKLPQIDNIQHGSIFGSTDGTQINSRVNSYGAKDLTLYYNAHNYVSLNTYYASSYSLSSIQCPITYVFGNNVQNIYNFWGRSITFFNEANIIIGENINNCCEAFNKCSRKIVNIYIMGNAYRDIDFANFINASSSNTQVFVNDVLLNAFIYSSFNFIRNVPMDSITWDEYDAENHYYRNNSMNFSIFGNYTGTLADWDT